MKVSVLVPSEEYRAYAGARIRYGRLGPSLARLGIDLLLEDVANFMPDRAQCDVLLISKCHDARSLVAASAVSERGKLVGVDLFDDYFSQSADSRLARFRNWLRQLLPICDFALCSTPAMAKIASTYRTDLPIHVVNDPAEDIPFGDLSSTLAAKLTRALDERKIRLAWFGVGDNPYFKVGLGDLAAYGGILGSLRRSDMDVEMTILTNARALNANGLALIGQLPVRTTVLEWTEQQEREALYNAFACFLPVNAQGFSRAKSLNRAVTALSAGCQVLSAGYPLYEPFGDFLYRDPVSLLSDLYRHQMRLSPGTVGRFQRAVEVLASPASEAVSLSRFLQSLTPMAADCLPPLALVHGQVTNGAAHKLVQSLHGFSVASPYCTAELGFDLIFRGEAGRLRMLVSDKIVGRLKPELRVRLKQSDKIGERRFWELPTDDGQVTIIGRSAPAWHETAFPVRLATYELAMDQVRERMEQAFGPCRVVISENSSIPFYSETEATRPC